MSTLRIKVWGQEWTVALDAKGKGWRANRDDAQLLPGTESTVPAHTLVDSSPWGAEAAVSAFVERETAAARGIKGGQRIMAQLERIDKALQEATVLLRHTQPLRMRGDEIAGAARCADYVETVVEHFKHLPGPTAEA